jgi:hypothetical protein
MKRRSGNENELSAPSPPHPRSIHHPYTLHTGRRYVSHQVQQLLDLRERISDVGKLYDAMQSYQLPTELRSLYVDLARDSVAHAAVNNWIHLSISLKQPDMCGKLVAVDDSHPPPPHHPVLVFS